jgi:hypothetical protein
VKGNVSPTDGRRISTGFSPRCAGPGSSRSGRRDSGFGSREVSGCGRGGGPDTGTTGLESRREEVGCRSVPRPPHRRYVPSSFRWTALGPAPAPGVRDRGPGLSPLRRPAADPRRGDRAPRRAPAPRGARPGRRAAAGAARPRRLTGARSRPPPAAAVPPSARRACRSGSGPHLPTSRRPCRTCQRRAIVRARRRRRRRRRERGGRGRRRGHKNGDAKNGGRRNVLRTSYVPARLTALAPSAPGDRNDQLRNLRRQLQVL